MSTQNPRVCVSKCEPCGSEKLTNPQGGSPPDAAVPWPCDPAAPAPAAKAVVVAAPLDETPSAVSQTGRAFGLMRAAWAPRARRGGAAARATGTIGRCVAAATALGVAIGCGAGVVAARVVA